MEESMLSVMQSVYEAIRLLRPSRACETEITFRPDEDTWRVDVEFHGLCVSSDACEDPCKALRSLKKCLLERLEMYRKAEIESTERYSKAIRRLRGEE